jgi:hypothetical protein
MMSFRRAGLHHTQRRPKSYQSDAFVEDRNTMAMTTLLLRLSQANGRQTQQSTALSALVVGFAILAMSMLTGCGPGGELEKGAIIPDTTSPASGGSNGAGGSSSPTASSASISLAWDPVGDPSVVGYVVHYGTRSPGSYGSCAYDQVTYSSSPVVTLAGLTPDTTYYFAVSAFNGREGACSAEVATVTSLT